MMKKITFLLILLTVSLGYSQELLNNGDFQTGDGTAWSGNAVNVVETGPGSGEYVNQAEVATAGQPWDVNVSQILALTQGVTYTFSFDAYTDSATGTRPITVGIGEAPGGANGANVVIANLTDALTTYTYDLVANYGNAGTVSDRVIFDIGAATGFVFLDNVSLQVQVLGVNDFEKISFRVFPNPSKSSWKVKTENVNMSSIQVFDVLGKNVLSLSPNTSETVINGSNLKSGLYFAQIKTETGINSIKLVKN